jgi:hypothetical protein
VNQELRWSEVSIAEFEAPSPTERVTIEVTPEGNWNCCCLFRGELEGTAGSAAEAKLAACGALATLLDWTREWQARIAGHYLLIVEVPEYADFDDKVSQRPCGHVYSWQCDQYDQVDVASRLRLSGEAPTLSAAQDAAVQALSRSLGSRGRR